MPFINLEQSNCVMTRIAKSASTSILRYGFETKVNGLDVAMKMPPAWANKFRFAFVRNPFDRLVSAWQMFQKYPPGNTNDFSVATLTLDRVLDVVEDDSVGIYDDDFWSKLKLHAIPMMHPHYRMQETDFVGRFETLEADWRTLCKTLKIKHQPLEHFRQSGRSEHYSAFYNQFTQKRASRIFAKDLVKFGYRFERKSNQPKTPQQQRPTFLFLCGVGRSGTTVLRRSLGTHKQIYYNGHENNVVQDIAEVALRNCTMKSRKHAMVVDQPEYDSKFRELLCALIWPDAELSKRPIRMAAINPTPAQLDYLRQVFPKSKFVGLVRNGIEVVSSRTEFPAFASSKFETHCDVWNRSVSVAAWGKQNQESFRLLRHEWLYAPEKLKSWLSELYQWLQIGFSDLPERKLLSTLEHPTSANSPIKTQAFSQSKIADRRNYFLSKRNRWRTWTPEQLKTFEDRCGQSMRKLNYNVPYEQLEEESLATG